VGPSQPNPALLTLLQDFASCELSLNCLRENIRAVPGINYAERWLNLHSVCPEPEIQITLAHIEKALEMRRRKAISEDELVDWATILLTNNLFFWDAKDARLISEWLTGISLDLVSSQ
jgi:hypothetical protein